MTRRGFSVSLASSAVSNIRFVNPSSRPPGQTRLTYLLRRFGEQLLGDPLLIDDLPGHEIAVPARTPEVSRFPTSAYLRIAVLRMAV